MEQNHLLIQVIIHQNTQINVEEVQLSHMQRVWNLKLETIPIEIRLQQMKVRQYQNIVSKQILVWSKQQIFRLYKSKLYDNHITVSNLLSDRRSKQ